MRSLVCVFLLVSACVAQSAAPSAGKQQILWQKLESQIQEIDQHLDGVMGIAIEDLTTGDHFFLHESEVFAQASSIKITVLANLYLQAERGKLKLTDLYTVQSADLVPYSEVLSQYSAAAQGEVDRELIPQDEQDLVRQYFQDLAK